jgi:hypothetical protein
MFLNRRLPAGNYKIIDIKFQNLFLSPVGGDIILNQNHNIKPTALIIDIDIFLPYYRTYGSIFYKKIESPTTNNYTG